MQEDERANPFQAPGMDVVPGVQVVSPVGTVLASRLSRLGAAIFDGLCLAVVIAPLQYFMGVYDAFPKIQMSPLQSVGWSAAGMVAMLGVHGYFLATSAQTVGKRLLGIQIVNTADDRPAPFGRIVLYRYLPMSVAALVPYVGGLVNLVDPLLIFRGDRRCLHDLVAGTRVIVKPMD